MFAISTAIQSFVLEQIKLADAKILDYLTE